MGQYEVVHARGELHHLSVQNGHLMDEHFLEAVLRGDRVGSIQREFQDARQICKG